VKTIIEPAYEPLLSHIGFNPDWVFTSPSIVVWRKLEDRENCTADVTWPDGRAVRLHIKRYPAAWARWADEEAEAIELLRAGHVPCLDLVAAGRLSDGRGFVITEDLAGFKAADKLIAGGAPFEPLLGPTAHLAAKLHSAGLHHRDLYLCHFFVRMDDAAVHVKLIDAARVRRLPGWPTRRRWVVKDLAQFWYSTTQLAITDDQRTRWLDRYAEIMGVGSADSLRKSIESKAARIKAHDARLNRRQPKRHVSLADS
jgi:hypothetical protein